MCFCCSSISPLNGENQAIVENTRDPRKTSLKNMMDPTSELSNLSNLSHICWIQNILQKVIQELKNPNICCEQPMIFSVSHPWVLDV